MDICYLTVGLVLFLSNLGRTLGDHPKPLSIIDADNPSYRASVEQKNAKSGQPHLDSTSWTGQFASQQKHGRQSQTVPRSKRRNMRVHTLERVHPFQFPEGPIASVPQNDEERLRLKRQSIKRPNLLNTIGKTHGHLKPPTSGNNKHHVSSKKESSEAISLSEDDPDELPSQPVELHDHSGEYDLSTGSGEKSAQQELYLADDLIDSSGSYDIETPSARPRSLKENRRSRREAEPQRKQPKAPQIKKTQAKTAVKMIDDTHEIADLSELPDSDDWKDIAGVTRESRDSDPIMINEDEETDVELDKVGHVVGHARYKRSVKKDLDGIRHQDVDSDDKKKQMKSGKLQHTKTSKKEDEPESRHEKTKARHKQKSSATKIGKRREYKNKEKINVKRIVSANEGQHGIETDVDESDTTGSKSASDQSHKHNKPRGPIAGAEKLHAQFLTSFTKNPKKSLPWSEPGLLPNCWAQAMMSARYHFSPSCNRDGTFGPKQCHLERCWCVHKDGSPQIIDLKRRFHFAVAGLMLICTQNGDQN